LSSLPSFHSSYSSSIFISNPGITNVDFLYGIKQVDSLSLILPDAISAAGLCGLDHIGMTATGAIGK
jgi:hypothetical protein